VPWSPKNSRALNSRKIKPTTVSHGIRTGVRLSEIKRAAEEQCVELSFEADQRWRRDDVRCQTIPNVSCGDCNIAGNLINPMLFPPFIMARCRDQSPTSIKRKFDITRFDCIPVWSVFCWYSYLALMAALASEADWMFIPECPPEKGWEDVLCKKLAQV